MDFMTHFDCCLVTFTFVCKLRTYANLNFRPYSAATTKKRNAHSSARISRYFAILIRLGRLLCYRLQGDIGNKTS